MLGTGVRVSDFFVYRSGGPAIYTTSPLLKVTCCAPQVCLINSSRATRVLENRSKVPRVPEMQPTSRRRVLARSAAPALMRAAPIPAVPCTLDQLPRVPEMSL